MGQVTLHGGVMRLGGDIDGHYPDTGTYWGVGAAYALGLEVVDLGAGFDYFAALLPDDYGPLEAPYALVPALTVRPHLPLSEGVELGLTLRAGWSWLIWPGLPDDTNAMTERTHTFSGFHLGLMPDVRLYLAPHVTLDLGVEAHDTGGSDQSDVRIWYREKNNGMALFGGFARVVLP
jgi:hypothetical protein